MKRIAKKTIKDMAKVLQDSVRDCVEDFDLTMVYDPGYKIARDHRATGHPAIQVQVRITDMETGEVLQGMEFEIGPAPR